ncbi:MAG: hypothetical protein JWM73_1461 [Solirubrobacterales bacterium]|nr:hypothetical protein [Solirubrobacterales bacterium]
MGNLRVVPVAPMTEGMSRSRIAGLLLPVLAGCVLLCAGPATAATPLPIGWPAHLVVGMSDVEGGAADLRATTALEARYHYLAGGVNTGQGWTTWAGGGGSFVSDYIADSQASAFLPVFSLYELRQSLPGIENPDEAAGDLLNLRTRSTMRAFFTELQTFYRLSAQAGGAVVLQVEPDLWGYAQSAANGSDDATLIPATVAATGLPALKGLPDTVAGVAQAIVRLRDQMAPNVVLGYHLSVWGTGVDIARSDATDAHVDELAGRSAAFYRSLGADYDVLFAEFADRTPGYAQAVDGDGGGWWDASDFARHARYLGDVSSRLNRRVILWQIPLGNRVMRTVDNTRFHYQDNRVEWLLGPDRDAHLAAYEKAGVIGLLFGKAQATDTCACDAAGDGITNPTAINGNRLLSTSADDDGGYFRRQVAAFAAAGPRPLPAATSRPLKAKPRKHPPVLRLRTTTDRKAVRRGKRIIVSVRIHALEPATTLVAVQLYRPGAGRPTYQLPFRGEHFRKDKPRRLRLRFDVPRDAAVGQWKVKVGVFDPDWKRLYLWSENAAQFTVR